jgi:rhodanese-related sulfurtransferase
VESRPRLEIDPLGLAAWRRDQAGVQLLDVRESWEREVCFIAGSLHIPLAQIVDRARELSVASPLVVYCHHGARSLQAVLWLRQQGFAEALNLSGGIAAWADMVEPDMARY